MIKIYDENNTFFAELKYDEVFYSNYSKHSHDMLSLTAISKGEINIDFHSCKSEVLKTNNIAVFNPNQVHISKNISNLAKGYFVLYLDTNWCIKLQNSIFDNLNIYYPIKLNLISEYIVYDEFINLCQNILQNRFTNKDIELFIEKLFLNYSKKVIPKDENKLAYKIKDFILNSKCIVELEDIVNKFSYSKEHIIRCFKKEFGLSPHAFIIDNKIINVKNQLNKDENLNLSQLAQNSGFYDQSHFNKNFKKVFGVSPKTYKTIKYDY